jgi:hypothetical protein
MIERHGTNHFSSSDRRKNKPQFPGHQLTPYAIAGTVTFRVHKYRLAPMILRLGICVDALGATKTKDLCALVPILLFLMVALPLYAEDSRTHAENTAKEYFQRQFDLFPDDPIYRERFRPVANYDRIVFDFGAAGAVKSKRSVSSK